MATSLTQAKASNSSSATSLALAFTTNVVSGSLLCGVVSSGSNGTLSVSDNVNGAWTGVDTQLTLTVPGGEGLRLFYFKNAGAGATTVTVSVSPTQALEMDIFAVAGANTSAPLTANHGTKTTAAALSISGTAFTPTAGSFILTGMTDDNAAGVSITPGTGWSDTSPGGSAHDLTKTTIERGSGEYIANAAASSTTPAYSIGTSAILGIAWAEFLAAAVVAVAFPPQQSRRRTLVVYARASRRASPPWPQGSLATPVPAVVRRAPVRFYTRRGRLLLPFAPAVTLPPLANIRARINRSWQRRGKFVEPAWSQGSLATPVPQVVRRSPVRFYTRRGKLFEVQPGVVLLPPLAVINRRIHRTWQRRGKITSPPWPQGSLDTPTPKVVTRAPGRWYLRRGKLLFIPTPAVPYAPLPNLTRRVHRSWQRRGRTIEPTWAQGPRTQYVPVVTSRRAVRPYIIRRGKVLVPVKVASGAVVYVPLRMLMGMGF